MPVSLSRQPTEKKGNHCESPDAEKNLSETGINGPAFSPFIMKGHAGESLTGNYEQNVNSLHRRP